VSSFAFHHIMQLHVDANHVVALLNQQARDH
jgi:hypothetical protein